MMEDILRTARGVLQTTPSYWATLAQNVEVALLSQPPAPGEWSAVACCGPWQPYFRDHIAEVTS